ESAQAYDNRCGYYPQGDTTSLCRGQSLPYEKTRGRSHSRLECSGNLDHFIRRPQEIENYGDWAAWIKNEGPTSQTAFTMRQKQPLIEWQGRVPYEVTETWNWIACELGVDGSACGYDTKCDDVPYSYSECDRQNRCRTHSGTKRVCHEEARACYHDVPRTASLHCSNEVMTYSARYSRDPSWKPSSPKYNEFIPNKYDLLPGEMEDVQVYNSSESGTVLKPKVEIGDPWNLYHISLSGSAMGAKCQQDAHETLDVTIATEHRLVKPSPNAFRLPVNFEGKRVDALTWMMDTDTGLKAKPRTLRLSDISASMVGLIAQQSRANAGRETLKREIGKDGNADQMAKNSPALDPFLKNTTVRIQLAEKTWYGTSIFSPPFYLRDSDAVVSANLSLSKLQSVRNSEFWEIPLDDPDEGATIYTYRRWLPRFLGLKNKELKPYQRYMLRFSMFERNVPFYAQNCDQNESEAACVNEPEGVFSAPLEVTFKTSDKIDYRPTWRKILEFTAADYLTRHYFRGDAPGDDDANVLNTPNAPKPPNASNMSKDRGDQ
ncbi:MAG: hypothetical protein C5B49_13595, partial [Bdellovibrio sp.]